MARLPAGREALGKTARRGGSAVDASGGKVSLSPEEKRLLRKAHQTLRHVTEDMEERWHFNTDIANTMELVNEISELDTAVEAGKRFARGF